MDPAAPIPLSSDPDATIALPQPSLNGSSASHPVLPSPRRADIDVKQEQIARMLHEMEWDAVLLLMPAHVVWFTAGMNVRGLISDSERPGVYTDGRQRWLICSNIDTHRLFDEELDELGFQLKEWTWEAGRAELLRHVVAGRKVGADRPFPNMPQAGDLLRPMLRVLSGFERASYRELGRVLAHALEATARNFDRGQSEEEVSGQVGHRLLRHGVEPAAISVTADGRGTKFRRAGFTAAPINHTCVLQGTAQRDGLYVTASRTVCFGTPPEEFRTEFGHAARLAAIYRSLSHPEGTIGAAGLAGRQVLVGTPYEYEWRFSQPGYGAGRFPSEELRRGGRDDPFVDDQPVVWQPRVGAAAVVETVLVSADGPESVTPPEVWPVRKYRISDMEIQMPDIVVRGE